MAITKVPGSLIDLDQLDLRYYTQTEVDDLIDGSGGAVAVADDGVTTVSVASLLNFIGTGVTVTDAGGGEASITISAGPQSVDSVFGRTGTVVGASGDYDADQITETATNKILTSTERDKLANIEALADVTDATNVNAAGAVMNSDTSVASMAFVIDDSTMATASATTVPTSASVKSYVEAQVVPDGDKGDITVSSSGGVWTIDSNVVTYAKMQNVSAASKLLGRGSAGGAGDPQEISLGTNITMSGTTLNVSTGTATLGDGDYGDITVSSSGTVMTIDDSVITNAKLADIATARIKGRITASTGAVEDLTGAQVRSIINVEDGATAPYEAAQTIYVSGNGNDSNNGLSIDLPKLTIGAAITAASALTPASDNIIVIRGDDAAEYAEDITIPRWVVVDMPNAHLIGGVSSTNPDGAVRLHRITKGTSGNAVFLNSATAGQFWVSVDRIDIDGTANGLVCSQAAALMADVRTIVNAGTNHAVVGLTTAPGHIHAEIEDIYLSSTGSAVGLGIGGTVHVHAKHILNTGAGAGSAINADAGTIFLKADRIDVTQAWDIESGATVYLDCDLVEETGSSANDGTLVEWKRDWTNETSNFLTTGTAATGALTVTAGSGNDVYAVTIDASGASGEFISANNSGGDQAFALRGNADGSAALQLRDGASGASSTQIFADSSPTSTVFVVGGSSAESGYMVTHYGPTFSETPTFADDTDNTKRLTFDLSGITTSTEHTFTPPDGDIDLSSSASGHVLTQQPDGSVAFQVVPSGGSSIYETSVATIAALKARDISGDSAGDRIWVDSYNSGQNQGGGPFVVIDDAGESDDGGYIIEPTVASGNLKYQRVKSGTYINILDYGAANDGVTDDTNAIQAAIDSKRGTVYIPRCPLGVRGTIVSQLEIYNGTSIVGDGPGTWGNPGSRLKQLNGSNLSVIVPSPSVISSEYMHSVRIADLHIEGSWDSPPNGNAPQDGTSTGGCAIDMNRRLGEDFIVENCHLRYFAESGFRCTRGATPGHIFNVASFWNGEYGFDLQKSAGDVWHRMTVSTISGDGNGIALVRLKKMGNAYDSISVEGVKSESQINEPNTQPDVFHLDDINNSTVSIKNVSVFVSSGHSINSVCRITTSDARIIGENWRAMNTDYFVDDEFRTQTVSAAGSISNVLVGGFYDSSKIADAGNHFRTKDNYDQLIGVDLTIDGTTTIDEILDEDNMSSNSATALATQQSIRAYVDAQGGGGGSSIYEAAVATVAALKARDISGDSAGDRIWVDEYVSGTNVGGGAFKVIDDAGPSDDGGMIIEPTTPSGNLKYQRMNVPYGWADVTHFGAVGDGSTDDLPAFQAACDYLKASANRGSGSGFGKWVGDRTLYIPGAEVTYRFTSGHLNISSQIVNVNIFGGAQIETTATDDCIFRFFSDDPGTSEYPAYLHRTVTVRDLTLAYTGGSSADIDAKHIIFDSNGESGSLFGPGLIQNVTFNGGRRAVSNASDTDGFMTNLTVKDCLFQGGSGSFVSIFTSGSSTGCHIENNQTSINDPIEATIRTKSAHDLMIVNNAWESNAGDDTSRSGYYDITDSHNVLILGDRFEWGPIADGTAIVTASNSNTSVTVKDISIANCLVDDGDTATLFKTQSGSPSMKIEGHVWLFAFDFNSTGRLNLCDNNGGSLTWDAKLKTSGLVGTENYYLSDDVSKISIPPGKLGEYYFGAVDLGTADGGYDIDYLNPNYIPSALPQPTEPASTVVMPHDGFIYELSNWKEDVAITAGGWTVFTQIEGGNAGPSFNRNSGDADQILEESSTQPIQDGNAAFSAGETLGCRTTKYGSALPNTMSHTCRVKVLFN